MNQEEIKILKQMIRNKHREYVLLGALLPYGLKVWWKVLNERQFNHILEINDGYAIIYRSYNIVVDEFIKYKLDPCLFMYKFGHQVRNLANNYIKHFKKNHHRVLNSSNQNENLADVHADTHTVEWDKYNAKLEYYLSFCKNEYEKNLLILKSQGYSNVEVATKLHVNSKKIENDLYIIRKNIRNNEIYI